mmetsp:Transcript_33706/g.75719  ORF Transcript_33706/g.75719 Transcript_33706/m.75719 type:complete len:219 (-) Transcript_33706:239-895(-)
MAKLPVVVQPPRPQRVHVCHAHCVILPCSHRLPPLSVSRLLNFNRHAAALELARSQLPAGSVTPREELAILHESQRVVVSCCHRHTSPPLQRAHLARLRHRLEVSQPEPPACPQPPRVDGPVQASHEVVSIAARHVNHLDPAKTRDLLRLRPSLPPLVPVLQALGASEPRASGKMGWTSWGDTELEGVVPTTRQDPPSIGQEQRVVPSRPNAQDMVSS